MAVDDQDRTRPIDALIGMLVAARHEMGQLRDQLQSRAIVGQAEGIVMERLGLEAPQAHAYLERVSTHTGSSLTEVATDVVLIRDLPGISHARLQA